ncbi:MAG TPA: winged helix-turn-helix domain-containing protein, partial [Polyangiaceae bacterium]|nr:winged helix-turn-helix domain-containing protein [Polyangiaceae bacterium]
MDIYLRPADRRRGLVRALYEQVREAIAEGRLKPGDRLPPSRELAERLAVSRHSVTTAYGFLVAEGFLEGGAGAGTRVAGGRVAAPTSLAARWAPRAPGPLGGAGPPAAGGRPA